MDLPQLLILGALVALFLYGRRRRAVPTIDERMARIETLLADLDARLRGLEQWAAQLPGSSFHPALPATQPPDVAPVDAPHAQTGAPPSLPLDPALSQGAPTSAATPPHAARPPAAHPQPALPVADATATHPQPARPPDASPAGTADAPAPSAPRPAPASPAWSLADLEQVLSGRGLAWLGGLAILIGALFFLGLAFTRGWIGPGMRVSIGLLAGSLLAAGGAWFFERREVLFGHVVFAVGLGIIGLALVAATRLYDLIPAPLGLLAALMTASAATVVAIRADSQIVAGYGLVTVLAAPPLLGAAPTFTTIAFLATALAGTTTIALYRSWTFLPPVAFLLAAPQLWSWLQAGAGLGVGLAALAAFGALNGVAAGGEEFRRRRKLLHAPSATLLIANAAFLVAAGFALLDAHQTAGGRGLYLIVLAAAHFALGSFFLYDQGERHPFGMLAFGTGIAALTMAGPIQLGAPVVPIAWAAEATALAWVYGRRSHGYSGSVAAVLGMLTLAHLGLVEYPFWTLDVQRQQGAPFLNANGGTLGFVLLALLVAGYLVRHWLIRAILAGMGCLLVSYVLPFELRGLPLLAGWAAVYVFAVAADGIARNYAGKQRDLARMALLFPAAIAGWLALGVALAVELSPGRMGLLPAVPFMDRTTTAAGILLVALLGSGVLSRSAFLLRIAIVGACALAAYLMPFELQPAAIVVAWAVLALGLCLLGTRDPQGRITYLWAAGVLLSTALLLVLGAVAPPDRLAVHAGTTVAHPLFWSGATAALGALIAVLIAVSRLYPTYRLAHWSTILAGGLTVYLLSVGIVDAFQREVRDERELAAVGKQAQVALSILWAALGGATFVVGVTRWRTAPRISGLALLALATAKVFLYDLASLDATYKVLSFIGLGILLLASSYAYQRLKPQITVVPADQQGTDSA